MTKPYRTTKIVIPGWQETEQRAYLVVDRETGEPLGRVGDMRLWNLYDPHGDHWAIAHSDEDLHDSKYGTMNAAVKRLWWEHKPVEPGREFPPINLEYAQNFDYQPD
jgi:hypothetical protein